MNNEKYNQIIHEAYGNYKRITHDENEKNGNWSRYSKWGDNPTGVQHLTKLSYIQMCKIDSDFSERWGLKIEERELSLEERNGIYKKQWEPGASELIHDRFDALNIPAKLITVTYKDEKIEVYE